MKKVLKIMLILLGVLVIMGIAAFYYIKSMMPSGDAAGSLQNPEMSSGGAGAAAPGRCSGKARP